METTSIYIYSIVGSKQQSPTSWTIQNTFGTARADGEADAVEQGSTVFIETHPDFKIVTASARCIYIQP